MPKRRRNINYRQTHSERSATNSARSFSQVQRMEGWSRVNFSKNKIKKNQFKS